MPDDHTAHLTILDPPRTRVEPSPPTLRQAEIARALVDVGLLRGFVSSRADRSLDRAWSDAGLPVRPPSGAPDKGAFLRRIAAVEAMSPAGIEASPEDSAFLFGARDLLNAVAAPADAYTIAFSGLYAGGLSQGEALLHQPGFAVMAREARTMRLVFVAITLCGVVAVILAMWLAVHALLGKSMLERKAHTAADLAAVQEEMFEADTNTVTRPAFAVGPWSAFLPRLCDRISLLPALAEPPRGPVQGFEGPRHYELCDRVRAARERHDVAASELATWIDTTTRYPMRLLPGLTVRDQTVHVDYTSEQVAKALHGALSIHYIPLLFGVVGGTVHAVRRLNRRIVDSELHPRDWRHALLGIFTAFLLGGCIGLFFSPEGVRVAGMGEETIALSIAALSFLAGYSVEVVFRFFDALIGRVVTFVEALAPASAGATT